MSYRDYCEITWSQFQLKLKGAQRKEERAWQQTRLIAYTIYSTSVGGSERMEVWDFYPLPSDPTEKERKKLLIRSKKKEYEKKRKDGLKLIERYQQEGYLKDINVKNGRRS